MLIKRLIALIIDGLILGVIGFIIGLILGVLGLDSWIGSIFSFVIGAGYYAYFLPKNGQTPGKSIMGIRVVKMGGGGLTPVDAILRYIGYYVNSFLLMIGWIVALFTPDNRGIHDYIAGTRVIDA